MLPPPRGGGMRVGARSPGSGAEPQKSNQRRLGGIGVVGCGTPQPPAGATQPALVGQVGFEPTG